MRYSWGRGGATFKLNDFLLHQSGNITFINSDGTLSVITNNIFEPLNQAAGLLMKKDALSFTHPFSYYVVEMFLSGVSLFVSDGRTAF